MSALFSKGDLIFNEFRIGDIIEQDAIFYWVSAFNINSGIQITLQILNSGVVENRAGDLFTYFDDLQKIQRKGFVTPELILQDVKFPLVLVYSIQKNAARLADQLKDEPDNALDLWRQAGDLLHVLHNRKVVHGLITEACFSVVDGQVQLGKFGYGLILSMGNRDLAKGFMDIMAPEFKQGERLTFAADVYGYARAVATWKPSLVGTDWYKNATATDPAVRYQKMRDVYRELQQTIADSATESDAQEAASGRTNIVPKFRLGVNADPPSGGKVSGSGVYYATDEIVIEAVPNKGWRFVGWTGDFHATDSVAKMSLNRNKTVTGRFEQSLVAENLHCSRCGKEVEADDEFCHFCGMNLAEDKTSPKNNEPIIKQDQELTPQPKYADFWIRAGAFLIDSVIIIFLLILIFWVIIPNGKMLDWFLWQFRYGNWHQVLRNILLFIVFYHVLFESSRWQATIGKRLLGLRITDLNGDRLSFYQAQWRQLAKIFSGVIFVMFYSSNDVIGQLAKIFSGVIFGIGFLMVAFTKKKQGLHDKLVRTLVVKK